MKGYGDGPVWDGPGPGSQERDGEKQGIQENYRKKSAQGLVIGRLKETMGQRQLELFFLCAKQYLLRADTWASLKKHMVNSAWAIFITHPRREVRRQTWS